MDFSLFKRKLFRKIQGKLLGINSVLPLELRSLGKVLVLAPHADDETIGAFSLLYGIKDIMVVVVTDCSTGEGENVSDFTSVIDRRRAEFESAMIQLDIENYLYYSSIPNDQLFFHSKLVYDLFDQIGFASFDSVFVPHSEDNHPDHRALNRVTKQYIKDRVVSKMRLFGYEVWTPISAPTHFADISLVRRLKRRTIHCYVTQQASVDYASGILGLNLYRGIQNNVESAEVFVEEL